jgi:hypothetical protein
VKTRLRRSLDRIQQGSPPSPCIHGTVAPAGVGACYPRSSGALRTAERHSSVGETLEPPRLGAIRVGMIMEDASAIALTVGSADATDRSAALQQLRDDSERINALVRAALALDNPEPV